MEYTYAHAQIQTHTHRVRCADRCCPAAHHVLWASNWLSVHHPSQEAGLLASLQVFSMGHPNLHPSCHSNMQRHTHTNTDTHILSRTHTQGWLNHSLVHKISLEQSASDAVGRWASSVLRPARSEPHHSLCNAQLPNEMKSCYILRLFLQVLSWLDSQLIDGRRSS